MSLRLDQVAKTIKLFRIPWFYDGSIWVLLAIALKFCVDFSCIKFEILQISTLSDR
jgi:hypothetical protein